MTRIVSWNINSIRIRLHLIKQLIDSANPDIICLQETKVDDPLFPAEDIKLLGFDHIYFSGQKSYNGVAILSKHKLSNVTSCKFIEADQKRHISATLPNGTELHNFYVPAGGDIADIDENPKFKDKLDFVDAMRDWSEKTVKGKKQSAIILGDMNIAPLEHDVWSHKQLLKVVSHTPIEVERMNAMKHAADWVDVMREYTPEPEKLYSWWSYRSRDWKASNKGRRLDHIWVTPDLKPKLSGCHILEQARGWEKPSDHAPIWIDVEDVA